MAGPVKKCVTPKTDNKNKTVEDWLLQKLADNKIVKEMCDNTGQEEHPVHQL